eukprot:TRINITY_DN3053_c0_g1_i1.p1 TRINITY_DN3053_c0_g1~~TRINITY_DN3053_c0_g1_i1.p1  ORF type:complete len:192 (-),score=33.43 TRINITY_DN3053_c0_g1_i1:20-595(-)
MASPLLPVPLPERYSYLVMTWGDLATVYQSWQQLPQTSPANFYDNMFASHPQIRALFNGDLNKQYRLITAMLDHVICELGDPDVNLVAVIERLESLGRRHKGYKVPDEYFPVFGEFLMCEVERIQGPAYTVEVQRSWTRVYRFITEVMIKGSKDHPHPHHHPTVVPPAGPVPGTQPEPAPTPKKGGKCIVM